MKKLTLLILLAFSFTLFACDSDDEPADDQSDEQTAEADDSLVDDIGDGLEPGDSELNVDGVVEIIGEADDDRGPADVGPASGGTNHDGPYRLRLRANTERDGEETTAYAMVVLPEGTSPGTYELTDNNSAGDDDAYAMFRATAQRWAIARDVEGEVTVGEIGDETSIAFEFDAEDGDGESVSVHGRVYRLGFDYSTAIEATRVVDGEESDIDSGSSMYRDNRDKYILRMGPVTSQIFINIPADIDAGSYTLSDDAEDDDVLEVSADGIGDVDGQIEIERDGNFAHGEFEFDADGDEEQHVSGRFEYMDVVTGGDREQ